MGRVMGVQLALLLAVPLIGLGIGSPQADHFLNSGDYALQAYHSLNGEGGLPSIGAGYSRNFPGGMNRGYQQEQSWQRMGGLGNRMGSPRYADYSRAGQYRYGATQNYADYGNDYAEEDVDDGSEVLFMEVETPKAQIDVFTEVPLDQQCQKKPGPTPNKGTASVKCHHKCMFKACYVTAHIECNCRSPYMKNATAESKDCLRGSVTGYHLAEHIPEKCRIKPESGCDDCERTHTKKEPLHTTCAEKIRGKQEFAGNLTVYCEFKCDDRAKKCWVKAMSMCERQSMEISANPDDISDIDGWYTKSEEEWRGPHDSKDAAYPPECRTRSVKECPEDCHSTDITTDPSTDTSTDPSTDDDVDDDVDDDLDAVGRLKFRRFRF